jgi:hypothetical protein
MVQTMFGDKCAQQLRNMPLSDCWYVRRVKRTAAGEGEKQMFFHTD